MKTNANQSQSEEILYISEDYNMTAKEYLQQAYRLTARIKSDLQELEDLRSMTSSIHSPGFERNYNPNRPTEAPFVKGLERIWVMEERINCEIERLISLREEIREVIDEVSDYDQKMLLRYRYINHLSWDDIAGKMFYGQRWLFILHGRALKSVESILKKEGSL